LTHGDCRAYVVPHDVPDSDDCRARFGNERVVPVATDLLLEAGRHVSDGCVESLEPRWCGEQAALKGLGEAAATFMPQFVVHFPARAGPDALLDRAPFDPGCGPVKGPSIPVGNCGFAVLPSEAAFASSCLAVSKCDVPVLPCPVPFIGAGLAISKCGAPVVTCMPALARPCLAVSKGRPAVVARIATFISSGVPIFPGLPAIFGCFASVDASLADDINRRVVLVGVEPLGGLVAQRGGIVAPTRGLVPRLTRVIAQRSRLIAQVS
jgi:hypothetical protein